MNNSEIDEGVNSQIQTDTDGQTAQHITVTQSGQLLEFINSILKPGLTFEFSTVSYLNICELYITDKTLL